MGSVKLAFSLSVAVENLCMSETSPVAKPIFAGSRRWWLRQLVFGLAAYDKVRARAAIVERPRRSLKQSIVHWPFEAYGNHWTVEQTCLVAKQLGFESVELVPHNEMETVRRHGLKCAIVQLELDPPFVRGWNNPENWPMLIEVTRRAIEKAVAYGSPNVICFTGYKTKDPGDPNSGIIDPDQGLKNCVNGLKKILPFAERQNVNLCLEVLNTRDTSHPMKGHPGYQGDHVDYCMEIIRQIGSPRMKLLFDVYHVQIMDGDLIRRIYQLGEAIGHVHIAGVPGRNEPDERQEVNYPAIMDALEAIGYQGYVGHEYIPTADPITALKKSLELCVYK